MPNDRSVNMICPYYMGEEKSRIFCEGCISDYARVDNVYRFRNDVAKEKHMWKYCATYDYGKCAYAMYKDTTYDRKNPKTIPIDKPKAYSPIRKKKRGRKQKKKIVSYAKGYYQMSIKDFEKEKSL